MPAGRAQGGWEVGLHLFMCLLACNPLKCDKVDVTSVWPPGRRAGSKVNMGNSPRKHKPIGTVWAGPVNASSIWEAQKIQMDGEDESLIAQERSNGRELFSRILLLL